MAEIHPTAIVSEGAKLGEGVVVGPYAVIGPHVVLGRSTRIMSHAVVEGHTRIGEGCIVYPFASIGQRTQDLKYKGATTYVEILEGTTIREFVTVNSATDEHGVTRIGRGCLLMAYAHVAHDCRLEDGVILANCATLGGHVLIEEAAVIGGLSGIHQFVRIGRLAMVGGCSKVTQDIPPFMLADGHPAAVRGINVVGLQRKGFSAESIRRIKEAHRILFRAGLPLGAALERLETTAGESEEVAHICRFVGASERGIAR
ncbi:MAG TPA: acyl-ACP--UDP-N-acetylglucosamine O-acyltransferase [Kiritimatiellae bacterium]|nr:acyl-ACP--UDP-N-acetylglucosamine O-acyltransferase [Kiritimatiellia bacterium]